MKLEHSILKYKVYTAFDWIRSPVICEMAPDICKIAHHGLNCNCERQLVFSFDNNQNHIFFDINDHLNFIDRFENGFELTSRSRHYNAWQIIKCRRIENETGYFALSMVVGDDISGCILSKTIILVDLDFKTKFLQNIIEVLCSISVPELKMDDVSGQDWLVGKYRNLRFNKNE